MKHLRLSLLTAVSVATVWSGASYAAGYQLYELGTPLNGTAAVGQAVASDASSAYYNPAAMSLLSSSELMLGSQILIPNLSFTHNNSNTIHGNNGGSAGMLAPGLGMYFVYNFSPKWKFGVSLTQPYGGAMNYSDHWVGRYSVQQMMFYTLDLNPSVAYQFNQYFSVGLGATIEYANLNQTTALPLTSLVDGQLTVKAAGYSPGFNLGATWRPTTATTVGLTFRSQVVHHLHGNVDFMNLSATPSATARLVMPANVEMSASQAINERLSLLGELGWGDWSAMKNSILSVKGYTLATPLNWNNTYRVGVGAQYQLTNPLLVRAGISYDSSPTTTTKRLPVLPVDRQLRLGIGLAYEFIKAVTVAASYEYIDFGNAAIYNTSSRGVLAGHYSNNNANVLQLSVNVKV